MKIRAESKQTTSILLKILKQRKRKKVYHV